MPVRLRPTAAWDAALVCKESLGSAARGLDARHRVDRKRGSRDPRVPQTESVVAPLRRCALPASAKLATMTNPTKHVFLKEGSRRVSAQVISIANDHHCKEVLGWAKGGWDLQNPKLRDAVDTSSFAVERWRARQKLDRYVGSFDDARQFITDNDKVEVSHIAGLVLFPKGEVLGVVHVRRLWTGNLALDHLAVHPKLLESKDGTVRGVGTALLAYAASGAVALNSRRLWAEITQNSYSYYKRAFPERIDDEILSVPQAELGRYCDEYFREPAPTAKEEVGIGG